MDVTEKQSPYETDNIMWEIRSDGYAYFHNIEADNGLIAGWHINNDMIYNEQGTYLSASGKAQGINGTYTISTNSLYASDGNIGGWIMSPTGFTGTNIALLNSGELHLGNAVITNMYDGIIITGGAVVLGFVVGDDHTTFDGCSLNTVYKDFEVNKYINTQDTRKDYLDWIHSNWGSITPTQVRAAGFNATNVGISDVDEFIATNYNTNKKMISLSIEIEVSLQKIWENNDYIKYIIRNKRDAFEIDCNDIYENGYQAGENNAWDIAWWDGYWTGLAEMR